MVCRVTGKKRDAETGLDYFQTRYFSSAQGRYTSPDPLMASARPSNPQTWNRYAYGLNNPLRYIDPDGMKEISVADCQKDSNCTVVAVNVILDKNANNGNGLTKDQMASFNNVLQGAKDDLGNGNIALNVSYTSGEVTDSGVSGLSSSAANVFLSSYVPTSVTGNAMVSGELNGATVPDPRTHGDVMFISANNAHGQYLAGPGVPFIGSLTNTITHEFLHNLSGDTSRRGDNGFTTGWHEFQIDRQASGLHLDINYIRPEQMQRAKMYSPPVHPDAVKPGK
jgi:RHS repeat-associated protein